MLVFLRSIFTKDAGVASENDFRHRCEVVLSGNGSDAIAAVVLIIGMAVGKTHHGSYDVIRRDVGNIEALHHARRRAEPESFCQIGEVFGWLHGGRDAATACELSSGGEGLFEVRYDVAKRGGFFEIQRIGCVLHFFIEFIKQSLLSFSFKDQAGFMDFFHIVLFGNAADAWSRAVADDIGVAMFVIFFAGDGCAADAEAESAIEPVDGFDEGTGMRKRAEVAGVVFLFAADVGKSRDGIGQADAGVEESFVVFERDVVTRSVVFDELALEDERFLVIADDVEFEIMDRIHQGAGFQAGAIFSGGDEIGGESAFEVDGFTDVDDGAQTIFHDVDTGLVRDITEFGFELLGDHGWGENRRKIEERQSLSLWV